MVKEPSCNFAVQVGEKKQMIIRTKLEEYLIENRLIKNYDLEICF